MSELSFMGKLMKAMELSKAAHTGLTLTYFDVIELSGEIEALKGYIAELEAERRWIPVSERLPENISNVLILSRGEQLIASYLSKYSLWYVPFVDKPVVTHWMPLPELPEVQE